MKKITFLAMSFMMALVVNAQDAGKDITSQFENTDFETGDTSGWDGGSGVAPSHNSTAAANNFQGTHFMEAWCASTSNLGNFDWSQTVDVPNGYYVVKALAHAIKQNQTTTPAPNGVYVYAEDEQTQVTTTTAAEYTVFAEVTDGALTIGYRGVSCNVNWVVVDYFRVIQCYGDTEEAAKISWMKCEMQEMATAYEDIRELDMSASLKDEIEASIAAIETVSTYAEAETLWTKMKQQMEDADACIDAYDELDMKISDAYDFADEQGADDLYDVIEAIADNYDAGAYDATGALAAIDEINDAIFEFNLSIADGTTGFPVTELYVTNPTWREKNNMTGWDVVVERKMNWGTFPAWGTDLAEIYQCDFNISQTLTGLRNGKYKVRVQAFYRGTLQTAELFANNDAVKLLPLNKYSTANFGTLSGGFTTEGYANDLTSASAVFNTKNPNTERNFYDENELEVIVMDSTLTFGIRSTTTDMGTWCAFRDFQLYYYGNYPCVNLKGKMDMISTYFRTNPGVVPNAVVTEMNSFIETNRKYTIEELYEDKDDEVNAVILQLDSIWAEALAAADLFTALKAQVQDVNNNLLPLDYPGKADLSAVLTGIEPYLISTSTVNTYANLVEKKTELEAAIIDYYFSQEATPEIAADYTFLVPNPNFEQKGDWTWNVTGGGTDQWIGNCRPTKEGGDSRRGVNLWGWGITSVDVHQRLTDLPDGLYKVSAEMITQNSYATDQHVYATSGNKVVSENLSTAGWDTYEWTELTTTDYAVVIGGNLTIGAESSIGGTNSEGWFQATNFKLYYHGPASAEYLKAAWENTEARANDALEILIPNEKKELAAAMEQATPLAAEEKYGEACALVAPMIEELDSIIKVTKAFYDAYYAKLDTIRLYDAYDGCEQVYAFADATIALADAILESDTTTCSSFPTLDEKLHAYANYAASLRDAENALKDSTVTYLDEHVAFLVDSIITPQNDTLLCQLATVEYCNILRESLDKAVNIFISTANFSKEINEGDVTYLIINPTCDIENDDANNVPGWTWVQGTGDKATHDAEHYDTNVNSANKARFLNSWGSGLNSTFYQEIIGIPDGTYKLTVAARTDGDNAYIFAATTPSGIKNDTTVWQMVKNYGAYRGEIWSADSLLWDAAGRPEARLEENYPYFMARPDSMGTGEGYGWSWHVIENIEVTNRYLNIGFTADNTLTGKDNFTGWWMSADDWKLELIKKNEVQSEYNPFAGVEEIIEEAPAPVVTGIYDLFGRRIDAITAPGLYIVNGKKVLVK